MSYIFPTTPKPPDFEIDWECLDHASRWLMGVGFDALVNCMQNEVYHSEGSVWNHTKMVLEELVKMDEWRELSESDRSLMFLAVLFHDIGKPDKTVVDDDGYIGSRGHARKGATLARSLVEELDDCSEENMSFDFKNTICNLVSRHGIATLSIPLSGSNATNDPYRRVAESSYLAGCKFSCMIARADMRGRIVQDKNVVKEALDSIDFFEEIARDLGCWDRPLMFVNGHTRFRYFNHWGNMSSLVPPDYEMFDDTKFEVTLLCGIPGVGKDHLIKKRFKGANIVSLDDIRLNMGVSPKDNQGVVSQEAMKACRVILRDKQPFVFNATNLTRSIRQKLIGLFYDYHARTKIIHLVAPLETIKERNSGRDKKVPENVIHKLFLKTEVPTLMECHSLERIES